jgi:hypothetical protein
MPYTPTPFVNFQYEPEKSDIRRLLDSQQKMKKEKQADQSFDMEMKQAQQAYDMGVLKIKEAQVKTDEILKAKQLDEGSSQIYQSVKMSGASEADALRAVKAYRTQNGGWAQRQADQETEHETLTKALSMAKMSPALADKAANLINSSLDPNGPQMTGAQLYELQNRKEPIKLNENGDFAFFEFDSNTGQFVPTVKRFQSEQQKEEAKQEQAQKKAEFDMKMAEGYSRISENQQQIAESKARVALAGQKKKDDMTYEEKQTFMALNKTVSQLDADVRRIQFYKAKPAKQSDTLAMLSMLTGQVQASTGNPEADKQVVEDLINARLAEYSQALDELEQLPEGKRIAQSKRRILEAAVKAPVAKPVVDPEGKSVVDPGKVTKPNLFKGFIGSFQ